MGYFYRYVYPCVPLSSCKYNVPTLPCSMLQRLEPVLPRVDVRIDLGKKR